MRRRVSILLAVGLMILALAAVPVLAATISGTNDNDSLLGTQERDLISGLGGNDTIIGFQGNDSLDGGSGDDEVFGNAGNDVLVGGTNRDTLRGNSGNDFLNAEDRGQDFVSCGPGEDRAVVDPVDVVSSDCETVRVASGSSGSSG